MRFGNAHDAGCCAPVWRPGAWPHPVRRRCHAVADAALGEDVDGLGGVVAELAAQAPDERAHQLRVDVPAAPDEARQVVVGAHAAGVAGERAQQVVLGGGEVQLAAGEGGAAAAVVDGQLAKRE
ncbi:MAG: hypothetical protein OXG04_26715, partial [Acidobacteria bacterium]|nr:hypothetical protein [Acidobacteriota bacterium]